MTTSEATQKITDYVVENFQDDDLAKGASKETNPYLNNGELLRSLNNMLPASNPVGILLGKPGGGCC